MDCTFKSDGRNKKYIQIYYGKSSQNLIILNAKISNIG
jgi:hypothetical protein